MWGEASGASGLTVSVPGPPAVPCAPFPAPSPPSKPTDPKIKARNAQKLQHKLCQSQLSLPEISLVGRMGFPDVQVLSLRFKLGFLSWLLPAPTQGTADPRNCEWCLCVPCWARGSWLLGKELLSQELLSPAFPLPCLLSLVGFMFNPAVSLLMVQVVFGAGERQLLPWSLFSKGGTLGDCVCPVLGI